MKKLLYIIPAAILLAASCTSVTPEMPEAPVENLVPFTISGAGFPVSKAEASSKTSLADLTGSTVNWTEGDEAILFDDIPGCGGHRFTGTVLSDKTKIDLEGVVDEKATRYYLVYPYNSGASMSGDYITTTLSPTQTAVAGSFADKTAISFASGTRTPGQAGTSGLSFSNCCSILKFTMPSYVDGATEVTITSKSGTTMAGTMEIAKADGSVHSVSGSTSVKLSGTLQAGATYFVVIAPGTYTNGFTFTVKTAGGNSYSTSSTRTIEAESGTIYLIGILGLVVDATPSVQITHTTDSNGYLNGSDAELTLSVPSELASMISAWDILLKDGNGTTVRSYSSTSGTGEVPEGHVYLPKGTYTISGTYTTKDGRVKNIKGNTATSPAPTFDIALDGYTSYNYGVGADGYGKNTGTANGLNGSSIYAISATLKITPTVLSQLNFTAFSCTLDGNSVGSLTSSNRIYLSSIGSQSWGPHTISASATFDGVSVSKNNSPRSVYVTGIPYVTTGNKMANVVGEWSFSNGHHSVKDNNYVVLGKGSGACKMSKTFYSPGNATLNVDYKIYGCGATVQTTVTFDVGSTQVFQQKTTYMKTFQKVVSDATATFTSSSYTVSVDCSYGAGLTGCEIYYINLRYK